jgi:SAM-dependent methyltransferase
MIGRFIKTTIEHLLAKKGFAIKPLDKNSAKCSQGYISAKDTVSGAEREGLSVCDYVEKLWGKQGDTQKVIDQMGSSGAFDKASPTVLEIGAGTGRYLEKVLQTCNPVKYESYETARDWADWLQATYPIVSHKADGVSLKQTQTCSVDLLHAHGVFVYLTFLISYRYFMEIWRVVKDGGYVVFDIISENCLDHPTVCKWLASEHNYPCFLSREYVVSLFEQHDFSLVDTFMNCYGEGKSEYLAFRRDNAAQQGPAVGRDKQLC